MNRRIICWITPDLATLLAAKYAIRDNADAVRPLPLIVAAHRCMRFEMLEQAYRYLRRPITLVAPGNFASFHLEGDVHVHGVPVDEPRAFASIQSKSSVPCMSPLADRALRRADCIELAGRDHLAEFPALRGFAVRAA
jgi:hypothetical protein